MEKSYNINQQIKSNRVKLVLSDGTMKGEVDLNEALQIAEEADLDLIEVSSNKGDIPVCKLADFGKMQYELKKKQKGNKHIQHTKEIKYSFNISDHDLEVKNRKIREFLEKKYIVKCAMELHGRESYMIEDALVKFNSCLELFQNIAKWNPPFTNKEGRKISISTTLRPI